MQVFSTNETVSLTKTITTDTKPACTTLQQLESYYEIPRCVEWIRTNNFKQVCLQFPDRLLPDANAVAQQFQSELGQIVYVLGDTSYESCCVDYVGAAHVNADAIVHYGPVCFGKLSGNIPSLMIYEKWELNCSDLKEKIRRNFNQDLGVVLLDAEYLHVKDKLVEEYKVFCVHETFNISPNTNVLFVGKNEKKLMHLKATLNCDELHVYDPEQCEIKTFEIDSKVIKRRYFLSEKIKDSKIVGIIVGTLAIKNYLKVVERMKNILKVHKKKYYIISVGKLTTAKLANFPEIEICVLISCSMSDVFENRDFYQTIVTPFDIEIALNNKPLDTPFSYDYNHYLDFSEAIYTPEQNETNDVSLITGKIRKNEPELEDETSGNEIALKSDGTVAVASHFLNQRSWRGLEQKLGETPVTLAEEGRSGTAFSYKNEPNL